MSARIIHGMLEAHQDVGTEGVRWSVEEDGKPGDDGLHRLKNGDRLQVFNDAACGTVLWEGEVRLEFRKGHRPWPDNPSSWHPQQVLGMAVRGLPSNADPEEWARMFLDKKPCILHADPDRSP